METIERNVDMELVNKILNDFNNGEPIEPHRYFTDYGLIKNKEIYTDAICYIKNEKLIEGLNYAMREGKYVGVVFYDKAKITEKGKILL